MVYGGNGNDSILGNASNDKLFSEVDTDILSGGDNNDTLTLDRLNLLPLTVRNKIS